MKKFLCIIFLLALPVAINADSQADSLREANRELVTRLSRLENRAQQQRWNRLEGLGILSGTTVQATTVIQDGRLVLGTGDKGLLVYDGLEFISINSENGRLPDNFVTAVEPIGTDKVAAGTASGLVFFNLSDFEPAVSPYPGIPDNLPVTCLKLLKDNSLAIGTMGRGMLIYSSSGLEYSSGNLKENDENSGLITAILEKPESGNLLLSTAGAGVFSLDQTSRAITQELALPGTNEFYGLAQSRDGIWAAAGSEGLWRKNSSRWAKHAAQELTGLNVAGVFALSDKSVLVGTDDGAFLLDPGTDRLSPLTIPEELIPYPVVAAAEKGSRLWIGLSGHGALIYDRGIVSGFSGGAKGPGGLIYDIEINLADSSVWFAGWDGISIFDYQRWRKLGRAHGLPHDIVTDIYFPGGDTLWTATFGGAARLAPGDRLVLDRDSGLLSNSITNLTRDRAGRLWLSSAGGGVYSYFDNKLTTFTRDNGLGSNEIFAADTFGDSVWLASKSGIALIYDNKLVPEPFAANLQPTPPAGAQFNALKVTATGSVVCGGLGTGLWILRNGASEWENYSAGDGLLGNDIFSLAEDRQRNLLLIGGREGISLFDFSQWSAIRGGGLIPSGTVKSIRAAGDRRYWVSVEERGVFLLDLSNVQPPETYIFAPCGDILFSGEKEPTRLSKLSTVADSADIGYPIIVGGEGYRSGLPAIVDTLRENRFVLRLSARTGWWPDAESGYRFSVRIDNEPAGQFQYQREVSFHGLGRGLHQIEATAKDRYLLVDSTPAVYRVFIDTPSPWQDWRVIGAIILALLALIGILFRKQISWLIVKIRYGAFRPLEQNPFTPFAPAEGKENFHGREQVIGELTNISTASSFVLLGGEKSGVSSILLNTRMLLQDKGAPVHYFDLDSLYFSSADRLVEIILRETGEETVPADKDPLDCLKAALKSIESPTLIIFDRAERLSRLSLLDPERCAAFVLLLRQCLLDSGKSGKSGKVSFAFGVEKADEFRSRLGSLFEMSRLFRIGPLDREAVRELVREPLRGKTAFSGEAVETVLTLSESHPHLVQYLCNRIVETANHERTNIIDSRTVNAAADLVVADSPEFFDNRWSMLARAEKLVLAACCTEPDTDNISLAAAYGILENGGLSLLDEEILKAFSSLAEKEFCLFDQQTESITLKDTLFKRWVAKFQPLKIVGSRDEYDFGSAVRYLATELGHSFRAREQAEIIHRLLEETLKPEWLSICAIHDFGPGVQKLEILSVAGEYRWPVQSPGSLSDEQAAILKTVLEPVRIDQSDTGQDSLTESLGFPAGSMLVPVISRSGLIALITLGGKDSGQGRYSRKDFILLQTVAEQCAVAFENARMYEEETEKERMRQELDTARRMQFAILPKSEPDIEGIDFAAFISPATEVGGDYYDFKVLEPRKLAFLVGDVSGHGISAGTLVSMSKSCIFNQLKADYSVPRVMSSMNEMVKGALAERLLMTFCYSIFDLESRTLEYSIAGHPFPYRSRPGNDKIEELEMSAYPLGVSAKAQYNSATTDLKTGDLLIFYSDGITEGINRSAEQWGFERFESLILEHRELSAREIVDRITRAFYDFSEGHPQEDDITLVAIKIL